jgi:transketolase
MRILEPGTPIELDHFLKLCLEDKHPYYIRLSERRNVHNYLALIGKAVAHKTPAKSGGTVVAVGTSMRVVYPALDGISDATILYYPTAVPFDVEMLQDNCPTGKVLLVEPHYTALIEDVIDALGEKLKKLTVISVPRQFIHQYGSIDDLDSLVGLTTGNIRSKYLSP